MHRLSGTLGSATSYVKKLIARFYKLKQNGGVRFSQHLAPSSASPLTLPGCPPLIPTVLSMLNLPINTLNLHLSTCWSVYY